MEPDLYINRFPVHECNQEKYNLQCSLLTTKKWHLCISSAKWRVSIYLPSRQLKLPVSISVEIALYCQCKPLGGTRNCFVFALFYDESLEINCIISNSLLWIKESIKLRWAFCIVDESIATAELASFHADIWSIATLKVTFSFADSKKSGLAVFKDYMFELYIQNHIKMNTFMLLWICMHASRHYFSPYLNHRQWLL